MTADALMYSVLPRVGVPQRRREDGSEVRRAALPTAAVVLFVVLGGTSGCKGSVPDASAESGGGLLTVEPPSDLYIGSQEDFDLADLRHTYVLTNESSEHLPWEVRVSQPWLGLRGPESGDLAPGESTSVSVDVDTYTATLGEGEPAIADVVFLNGASRTALATRRVTVEARGWTVFAPSSDTRKVYVSRSDGDDSHDGLTQATAKSTIAAGVALLRHGFPDWLLLKRGDVWRESLGQWKKSGRSASEPMVVSTYGPLPDRPLLRTSAPAAIWTNGGGGSPATIDNLAVVGLHFQPDRYTGGGDRPGAQFLQSGSNYWIEDCKFEGYSTNLVFQGSGARHSDFHLRRSVIVDAYNDHSTGEHSQGLYAYGVDGLWIEENVFDHNGWSETVLAAYPDIYSHNLYIDNGNTGVVVRGNLIANAASHGLQLRCGGTVVNNLFVRNSISLLVGGGNDPEPGGVRADVLGNVILDGKDIDYANPRGWGIVLSNLSSGRVTDNVVSNNWLGTQPAGMILDGDAVGDNGPTAGVHSTEILRNVFYNWGGGVLVEGDDTQITDVSFVWNDLQNSVLPEPLIVESTASTASAFQSGNNRFFNEGVPANAWTEIEFVPHSIDYWKARVGDTTSVMQQLTYNEPTRSLADYNVVVGGTYGLDAFLVEARRQSFTRWRSAYTAARANLYIRAGF